jgi:hypothetical protein
MRSGIREFQPRQPLDRQLGATTLNQILRELESLRITRVVNGTFRKLPGGTEITVATQRGGTPTTRQPWDLIARVDPDSTAVPPDYLVRVQPGTLNGILPSNWDEEFECAGTGLHYAKAVITTDGEAITGVTIAIDTTEPTVQEPEKFSVATEVEYLFGLFAEGAVYRVIGGGHITLLPTQWMVVSADPPAQPGELPYAIYYRLQ